MDGVQFRHISRENSAWLETEFSFEDIKAALKDLGGDKALGPDSFNFNFFKSCWETISPDFLWVFIEFH